MYLSSSLVDSKKSEINLKEMVNKMHGIAVKKYMRERNGTKKKKITKRRYVVKCRYI